MKLTLSACFTLLALVLSGCEKKESLVSLSSFSYELEVVPDTVGKEIQENLTKFSEMTQYPEGFERIEDVKYDWISIAGIHTRKAVFEDLFLFPYLNASIEKEGWDIGIAFKKNSPIVYTWKLKD